MACLRAQRTYSRELLLAATTQIITIAVPSDARLEHPLRVMLSAHISLASEQCVEEISNLADTGFRFGQICRVVAMTSLPDEFRVGRKRVLVGTRKRERV
jgi:hypothetical protein